MEEKQDIQTLDTLQDRLKDLHEKSTSILAVAEAAKRDLTEDESADFEATNAEFESVRSQIARHKAIGEQAAALAKPAGRQTAPAEGESPEPAPAMNRPRLLPATIRDTGKQGWRTMGEFALGVRAACLPNPRVDERLKAQLAPTTYGNEMTGAEGGFAVPPDFRSEIRELVTDDAAIFARCDQVVSSSNHFSIPKDTTTPWQTSGGILAYWDGENQQYTQSKPSLERETIPLNKLTCLVPVTDELAEDAPGMESYLRRKAPAKMRFKMDLAVLQGTGVGQPLGILNSGGLVTQAKEGSQTADTIVFNNIIKMWSKLYAPSRPTSIWVINQDCEPQLAQLEFVGTNATTPAYLPANGLAGSPYGTLLGRPVIPSQATETLGDLGDIFLFDPQQYLIVQRTSGIRTDVSIHLWFDYNTAAFRFTWRVGGRPWWSGTASGRDGSPPATYSPYVTLAERA